MVVYLDQVLAVNAAVDWLLLRTAADLTGGGGRPWRLWAGAGFGALAAAAVYLPGMDWLGRLPGAGLSYMGLCWICFGRRGRAWKSWIWFFCVCCAFGGLALAMTSLLRTPAFSRNGRVYYQVTGLQLVGLAAGLWLGCHLCLDRFARHRGRELTVLSLELRGRRAVCTALRDNGNTLREPVTGEAVIVARWQVAARLLPELELRREQFADPPALMEELRRRAPELRLFLVPFQTVGNAGGLLLALRMDRVRNNGRPAAARLVAFSPTEVSDGGAWEALCQPL